MAESLITKIFDPCHGGIVYLAYLLSLVYFLSAFCALASPFKYLSSKENDIHHNEEENEDQERQLRLHGREVCKKHERKAEDDSREVLIDKVILCICLVHRVKLTEKHNAGACCTGKHAVHTHELLCRIIREELLGDKEIVEISSKKACNAENNDYVPIFLNNVNTDSGDTRYDHNVEAHI